MTFYISFILINSLQHYCLKSLLISILLARNVQHVVAGFDYTYGKLGKGTMEILPFHSRSKFTQTTIDKLTNGEEKISSTLIRENLANGDMHRVKELLGRYYEVSGTVTHGEKRGRQIGFPTANIALDDEYLLPAHRRVCC